MQKPWSNDEIRLLFTDMSTFEIADQLGRTADSVRTARYRYTRNHCAYTEDYTRISEHSQVAKEARIISLCHRLGVRLQGVR